MFPVTCVLAAVVAFPSLTAEAQTQHRTVQARDGDLVLLPPDATITIARSTTGVIKVAAHQEGRLLVVLIDEGPNPDGSVDAYHRFELKEPFPDVYAWHGEGAIEEYESVGRQRAPRTVGIVLPQGRILVTSGPQIPRELPVREFVAVIRSGASSSRLKLRGTFSDVEQEALTGVTRDGIRTSLQVGTSSLSGGVTVSPAQPPSDDAPLRVGGGIRKPTQIRHVDPVMPARALQLRIEGVVLVEVTIDEQGKVRDARILRSIPMLDQAALDAVRQWEFEPVLLNGVPRPVIMTVPVTFRAQ